MGVHTWVTRACSQAGSYVHNSLHDYLKGSQDESNKQVKKKLPMARVSNFPCPVNLDKRPSVVHVHPSNGVFVAVDGDTVYCSCTECHFQTDRTLKGGSLSLVEGTEGRRYGWAVITEEVFKTLVHSIPVTGESCARDDPAVCVCTCVRALRVYLALLK